MISTYHQKRSSSGVFSLTRCYQAVITPEVDGSNLNSYVAIFRALRGRDHEEFPLLCFVQSLDAWLIGFQGRARQTKVFEHEFIQLEFQQQATSDTLSGGV